MWERQDERRLGGDRDLGSSTLDVVDAMLVRFTETIQYPDRLERAWVEYGWQGCVPAPGDDAEVEGFSLTVQSRAWIVDSRGVARVVLNCGYTEVDADGRHEDDGPVLREQFEAAGWTVEP